MSFKHRDKTYLLQAIVPIKSLILRLSLFLMIVAALGILALHRINPAATEQLRTRVTDMVAPVLSVLSSPVQAWHSLKETFGEMVFLYQENIELRQENDRLLRLQAVTLELEAENRRLRELLHYLPEPGMAFMTARVVGDVGGPYTRSAIINSGSEQEIRDGQVVTNQEGLVGRIFDTGKHSARILLITDLSSRIPVVTEHSRERAVLAGNNSAFPAMIHVEKDTVIQPGEKVLTSGDGLFFPPGLRVGVIKSVEGQKVSVAPFVDWSRLEYINIIDYEPEG